MFYDEAMEYIRGIEADGSDYGLERERALLDALGSPDDSLRIVHVAGTNGKGSVCAMLTSVLVAAGFRVGTYNSPSVLRYNERFLLDGVPLSDDKVAHYMTVVRDAAERERAARAAGAEEGAASGEARAMRAFRPTAFEQETALALTAFKEEGCDWAVLETGLGGRWDATNAVHSKELAVITKIGYDHCALLGNTLKEIASEKAAIIKGAAVTCAQEADAAEVLYPAVTRVSGGAELISRSVHGQKFVSGGEEYVISLLGRHQTENAALAAEAVRMLRERGADIPESALKEGLKRAVWHTRFEVLTSENFAVSPYDIVVPHGKTVVLDGAHNPQGAASLAEALGEYFPSARIAAVVGMLADKDYRSATSVALAGADRAYAVTPDSPRALAAGALAACIEEGVGIPVEVCGGVKEGLSRALASDAEVVAVFGSLTLFHELAKGRGTKN